MKRTTNTEFFKKLDLCCKMVAEKYGKPDLETWTNSDYLYFSNALLKRTGIQISPSTLKRIFGKVKTTERYYPQNATRDALAQYIAFENWEDFLQKNPLNIEETQKETCNTTTDETTPAHSTSRVNKKNLWLLPLFLLLLIIIILIWSSQQKNYNTPFPPGTVKLICLEPEGGNPLSASFKIQLSKDFSGDFKKFSIDYGDRTNRVFTPPRRNDPLPSPVSSHYYEIPGRYYPVLYYEDIAVDTATVYLKTNGWNATAVMGADTTRVYPINTNLFKQGGLNVTANELFHSGVDTNHTFLVHFSNSMPFNIDGDNFELKANVTASLPRPGVRCSQVNIDVYGENSQHTVIFIKPGCVIHAYLRLSEILKNGATDDVNFLGTDLTGGGAVKFHVQNKYAKLFVNGKLIYEGQYHSPLNKIYGVKVVFSGIGTLHNLTIKDLKTGQTFSSP